MATTTETAPADPARVRDLLDDAEGKERTTRRKLRDLVKPSADPPLIRVTAEHRGRRTGWAVECSACGVVEVLFPRVRQAKAVALDHANGDEHPEGARVRIERE